MFINKYICIMLYRFRGTSHLLLDFIHLHISGGFRFGNSQDMEYYLDTSSQVVYRTP